MTTPPICDYEGSDYQTSFWDKGGREYEDRTEAIALKRLLPTPALPLRSPSGTTLALPARASVVAGGAGESGRLLLELGAGAGRNTPRYLGFDRIVLLDYSRTQLEQAQARLGKSDKYVYVAADAYRLPFVDGLFDAATMIRTLHHMADAPKALGQVKDVLSSNGVFILEYANKLNLKAILRYLLGRQKWSPFTLEPVEFVKLNFDFHPKAIRNWLEDLGFRIEKTLTLSHFRVGLLKRIVPTNILVFLDSLFQWTGAWWQLSPSVFIKSRRVGRDVRRVPLSTDKILSYFKCPNCHHSPLNDKEDFLECPSCGKKWAVKDGIYDFREPVNDD